jgi:hypothetical protein
MRFAISIPQFVADGAFDPAGLRTYLARAEALGFDSAWTMEQVLGTMPSDRDDDVRGRLHRADPPGLRGVRHSAAQPGPSGQAPGVRWTS